MATFEPTAIPEGSMQGLRAWLRAHMAAIASTVRSPEVTSVQFTVLHAEPARYTDGVVVMADGSDWNPGSGAGVYARISGAWVKL